MIAYRIIKAAARGLTAVVDDLLPPAPERALVGEVRVRMAAMREDLDSLAAPRSEVHIGNFHTDAPWSDTANASAVGLVEVAAEMLVDARNTLAYVLSSLDGCTESGAEPAPVQQPAGAGPKRRR